MRKDHAGWTSSDEFSRLANLAQEILWQYLFAHVDEQLSRTALVTFQVQTAIEKTSNYYPKPNDYRDKLDAWFEIDGKLIDVNFPARNELAMARNSPVRGPSLDSEVIIGEILSDRINIFPSEITDRLHLRYYKTLTEAKRAFTLNIVTQEEEYDSGNSVDLDWDEQILQDFVDVLLYLKGIVLRDSQMIQWVQAKYPTERQITQTV
jgi:hypothetical protein